MSRTETDVDNCPVCTRSVTVTVVGTAAKHKRPGTSEVCPGSGEPIGSEAVQVGLPPTQAEAARQSLAHIAVFEEAVHNAQPGEKYGKPLDQP